MTINWIEHGNVTLRSPDSLMKDLDDAHNTIAELRTALATVVVTATNRKNRMHELQEENDQLRNRRD